ncbi:ribokinase [Fusobacterium varium]|uniref:ribokinase n=1 Tax=Fusobacterium varium TaxID=856 RepID=UPI000E415E9B|nr:ribokinase [Fusobacterium varium]MCF0171549.1 ribokinase [Fusobacterium varium]MCI6033892.1 ribokinase [Fusobacterium varium]MDY4006244.1 ribokinase [Fusobacterium varium]RGJ26886.1 ribokinase [Fusobacterium varium]
MKKVVVAGSINMDLVTVCERAPKGGETLFGKEFFQVPGGKGANQAVAIGKLGTQVTMLGKIGNDSFGKDLVASMKNSGVNTEYIENSASSTGIAKIIVEANGQNRILVVSGANMDVDRAYIDRHIDVINDSDILVTQLEIPIDTVEYVLKKAKEAGKITILNPAPAAQLNDEIIKNSDIIIPNESELGIITSMPTNTLKEIEAAAQKLLNMGVKELIVTLGSQGSLHLNKKGSTIHSAYKVNAVDTTAAGDSFIGGLVKNIQDDNLDEAIEFATKVSAITVTRKGAQISIPTIEEVENFKGEKNEKK